MSIEDQLRGLVGDVPDGISEGVALGTGIADGYSTYESPVGSVAVTFNPEGVSSVVLAEPGFEKIFFDRFGRGLLMAEAPSRWRKHIPTAIGAGSPGKLPVDLRSVTDFQAAVLIKTAGIPRGEVRSYGWLARQADRPRATRAVGSTMAANPVPLIIPCHRVVRSDGHIGAYSLGGPDNKWNLLEFEGAEPDRLEALAADHIRYQADTKTGVFCNPTCHVLRQGHSSDVVDLKSAEEAISLGYQPCESCRPRTARGV